MGRGRWEDGVEGECGKMVGEEKVEDGVEGECGKMLSEGKCGKRVGVGGWVAGV